MIKVEQIESVYSGKDGACCCGCSGKHYYNSLYVEQAGKNRGYKVSEDEVSDRMVKKVVRILNEAEDVEEGGNHISTVVGQRIYIAYFVEQGAEEEEPKVEQDEKAEEPEPKVEQGKRFVVTAQAFDRISGKPSGLERDEIIDTLTNGLFRHSTSIVDIKAKYESFWNDTNPFSNDVVFVSSVRPIQ